MLHVLVFFLFLDSLQASSSCPVEALLPNACGASKETLESVRSFQEGVIQKNNKLLENAEFQEMQLYVFVSFSLGEKALLNLAHEARNYGAPLVLRGFREGSLRKTVNSLNKIILKTGQGMIIDPEFFNLFNVTAVPTFILARPVPLQALERIQTPRHDRLQGHIGVRYVLETFAKKGDLKEEAKILLERGAL